MINLATTNTERFGNTFNALHGRRGGNGVSALTIGGQQSSRSPFSNATQMLQMRMAMNSLTSSTEDLRRTLRNSEVDNADSETQNTSDRPMAKHVMQARGDFFLASRNGNDLAHIAGFNLGEHRLELRIGDREFEFEFTVSATDTRQEVQQRIADAINQWAAGTTISASVVFNGAESDLAIEFDAAIMRHDLVRPHNKDDSERSMFRTNGFLGTIGGDFSPSRGVHILARQDTEITIFSNNEILAVDVVDWDRFMENKRRFGQDFTDLFLDAEELAALGRRSRFALDEEEEQADVQDFSEIYESMNDFISAFNTLMQLDNENSLQRALTDLFGERQEEMSQLGITRNGAGLLQIDRDTLSRAFANGTLQNSSFSSFLSRLDDIIRGLHTPQGAIFDTAV
ncbi:MAG: hypothetical protein FWG65_07360 [Turicibacter sp.]|nr:hypothetical protein [Turicibacter sp.]